MTTGDTFHLVPHDDNMSNDIGHVTEKESLMGAALFSSLPVTTTPQRNQEGKRRRLTLGSEPSDTPCSTGGASDLEDDDEVLPAALLAVLRGKLTQWSLNLVRLQPKVVVSDYLVDAGLALFRSLRRLQVAGAALGTLPVAYLMNEHYLLHDAIACWWLAMKHSSIRTAVPNRTLMCRATGASPALLTDRELAALVSLNWQVSGLLRKSKLLE